MPPLLSIVVPVLNEPHLDTFARALDSELDGLDAEVIVVADGAPVNGLPGRFRVLRGSGEGKGAAVRAGMIDSRGDVVMEIDADLAALLPRLREFVDAVSSGGYDVAIAERTPHFRGRGAARFVLSTGLFAAQRLLVFHSARFLDTQCGFKAYRGDVGRRLARLQSVTGGMYDIERLYAAVRNRLRIRQVRVGNIEEQRPTKIRLLKCLLTDPPALMAIKFRGLMGRYRL